MKSIRETFLADEGCLMVRIDLSQIEDRICKMYCGTPRMVELANAKPWDYDAHTENARLIFRKDDINKDERYLGKRTTHAAQRGMRGARLSENVSKDTNGELFLHPKQCDRLIDTYLEAMWEIPQVYFPWVRERVIRDKVLVNSWGRRLDLEYLYVDDDLLREAFSFYMQSDAADWTNQFGFIPGTWWMMQRYGWPLNAQVHDEVIASVPRAGVWEYVSFMLPQFEQTMEIPKGSGNMLCVPAEVTVARSWGDQDAVEFKRLPGTQGEFEEVLNERGFSGG